MIGFAKGAMELDEIPLQLDSGEFVRFRRQSPEVVPYLNTAVALISDFEQWRAKGTLSAQRLAKLAAWTDRLRALVFTVCTNTSDAWPWEYTTCGVILPKWALNATQTDIARMFAACTLLNARALHGRETADQQVTRGDLLYLIGAILDRSRAEWLDEL